MENSLSGIFAAVGHDPIAIRDTLLLCDFCSHFVNMTDNRRIFRRDLCRTADMLLRDQQIVNRCNRVDVLEHINRFIFVYFCAGDLPCDDLTKQAVFHD